MDKTKREELERAYRKEKDSRVVPRMLAVHMVRVREMSIDETAANLMLSERWVHKWLKRFDTGGLDGLRDLPRTGRPPKTPRYIMTRIIERSVQPRCTPKELQKAIREETGTRLHTTNVRKTMHRYGLTPSSMPPSPPTPNHYTGGLPLGSSKPCLHAAAAAHQQFPNAMASTICGSSGTPKRACPRLAVSCRRRVACLMADVWTDPLPDTTPPEAPSSRMPGVVYISISHSVTIWQ